MKREARYLVVKKTDMVPALTIMEMLALHSLCEKIAKNRKAQGKPRLECVVVEADWPEYEPTWRAIERRVDDKNRYPNDNTTGKWCYSLDEEGYIGKFDTAEEAHAQARTDIDTDAIVRQRARTYWIATCRHPMDSIKTQIGDDIMDMIEQRIADEIRAEEECLSISKQDEIDLSNLVLDFIRARAVVRYYGVANVTEHTVMSRAGQQGQE